MKGRKPKPTALRIAQGNPRQHPINRNEPVFNGQLGEEPPEFLDETAAQVWRQLVPILNDAGVTKPVEAAAVAAYCSCYADFIRASEMQRGKGFIIKTTEGDGFKVSPLFKVVSQLRVELLRHASELGLTPSARARIHIETNHDEEANPFKGLML